MSGTLRLGVAKVDITPNHPVPLAGFATRHEAGVYESVARPIYARIFWLRHAAENSGSHDGKGLDEGAGLEAGGNTGRDPGGETTALIVSADLIWWGEERVPGLKRRIRDRWNVEPDAILLHGTHSHSGPQTSDRFSDYLGVHDSVYLEQLETAVLAGIAEAIRNEEPVTAEYGKTECHIAVNRRKWENGNANYQANPDGPIDPALTVVRFRRTDDGRHKGVMVHYACHPVITQENRLSSEFCGVAMDRIERALGGDGVAAYLQGCCGDINPAGLDGELILSGDDPEVRRIGEALAGDALALLGERLTPLAAGPLEARTRTIMAPVQKVPTQEELEAQREEPWVTGDWSRKLLASPERRVSELPLRLVLLRIGDGLSLLAANAEIVAAYGLHVRSMTDGRVLTMGYTNGMIGYIPTAEQIREGGYESFWSTPYFLLPSPFDPAVEPLVRAGVEELIRD